MPPDLIGDRYRVGDAIGQGGMGTVWLARDEVLKRDVAVKQVGLLPGESVTDSARALREARSSAALSHRNVVTVFDVIDEDGAIWLVMEHVPSLSLADLLRQSGPLEPAEVANIGAQVADGLAAAHALGTTHRDVKPGNVLIRDDGVAKISDFGIARTTGDPTLTQSGMFTGTPSYFAPELARGAAPDQASDVWALGATLYAAVEGRPPYRAQQNAVAVLHQIATEPPAPPRRADFLAPVLSRMLDRDPASRWSMADAAHALHRLAREHSPENTRAQTLGQDLDTPVEAVPAAALASPRATELETDHETDRRADPTPTPTHEASGAQAAEPAREPTPVGASGPPPVEAETPTPSRSPRDRSDRPQRHRGAYVALVALALLLVAGGVGWVLTHNGDDGGETASNGNRSGASRSDSSSSSEQPSEDSSSSSKPSSNESSGTGSTGSGSKAAFVRHYFAIAPGGTDEGWSQLGPGEKAQGRASYDGFWRGIRSVTVSRVRPVSGEDAVDVTLTYRRTNGQTSTEHKRFDLIRSPSGGYLINGEHSIG
jgi:eukaryotic-like serine/threonine-protein kinase